MTHPTKAGRKPVSERIGSREDWRAKLNAALAARGERPIRPREAIGAGFRRSKYFQAKGGLNADSTQEGSMAPRGQTQRPQRKKGKQ